MQTSGLVLDVYDDSEGEVLRAFCPTFDDVPSTMKHAHALSAAERDRLPDEAFALILVNGGEKLRKYACVDQGNTELSRLYFLANGHKLPEEAQKVAAAYLMEACATFQIAIPEEMHKVAMLGALMAAPYALDAAKKAQGNLRVVNQLSPRGVGGVVTPKQMAEGSKTAEVTGTSDMPLSAPGGAAVPKTSIRKTAEKDVEPDFVRAILGEQPKSFPQTRAVSRVVDVTNKTPPQVIVEKRATRYAIPSQERYPLDSYAQVKAASAYFDEYGKRLSPEDRREYCANLVPRADALEIKVSAVVRRYGSHEIASDEEVKVAFDARRRALGDQPDELAILAKIEKVARQRTWKDAETGLAAVHEGAVPATFWKTAMANLGSDAVHPPWSVVAALGEFDKAANLDHLYDAEIPDPYLSLYGEKTAKDGAAGWSEIIGNDMVTSEELAQLALRGHSTVTHTFSDEFCKEFQKDPVGIFKSLPVTQKKILMRMANQAQPGNESTY